MSGHEHPPILWCDGKRHAINARASCAEECTATVCCSRRAYVDDLDELLENNQRWAAAVNAREPGFFTRLAKQQNPKYMWIGCADSRVPANELTGLDPGEVFVHRNVANVVVHSDLNALSTIQFAVEHLQVQHIVVVGH